MIVEKKKLDVVNEWLTPIFDSATQLEIKKMISHSTKELEECFYKNLEFGTGGMRGIMGVGTNRINKYTLGKSTQGLINYMKTVFENKNLSVCIAYDCRHNSKSLAKVVADVFSSNGVKVYLFSDLRPTPELSFAVRYLKCQAGIVLTASHNPPEYNGYKVYWEDGGQLVPPHDAAIIAVIEALKYDEIKFIANENMIEYIDEEIDQAFIKSAIENASFNTLQVAKDNLNIVFTSLHGTAIKLVPSVLAKAGYKNVNIVPEQAIPDGSFPTVKSPNPEEPEALKMALELAEALNADIVVGTDPDADRIGIAVRDEENKLLLLNGNQAMVLMTAFLLEQWKIKGKIDSNQFIGSTIVSTPMMRELASDYGVEYKVGLTGFKWIAKMIKDFPAQKFIGGGEESFGYMVGDPVRDKDAVASTLLICEIAARAKANQETVFSVLQKLYIKYGYYKEHLVSITKNGKEGLLEISKIMDDLRNNPFQKIAGEKVIVVEDYQNLTTKNLLTNITMPMQIPKSDVLIFYTEKGSKIAARPSGTESKIKYYISVNAALNCVENFSKVSLILDDKIKNILKDLKI